MQLKVEDNNDFNLRVLKDISCHYNFGFGTNKLGYLNGFYNKASDAVCTFKSITFFPVQFLNFLSFSY